MGEPYLDEYGVAADLLEEAGFGVVAMALLDMRDRVLSRFMTESSGNPLDIHHVKDGWLYVTDGRIAIRMRTSAKDKTVPKTKKIIDVFNRLWKPGSIDVEQWDWRPFPMPADNPGDDPDARYQPVPLMSRRIANYFVELIHKLPEPEYLEDEPEDYNFPDGDQQPVMFRFRCGEGIVMPLKGEQP